jgi:hypothetical protein
VKEEQSVNTQTTNDPTGINTPEYGYDHRFAHRSGWVGGAAMIVVGIYLLLHNLHLTVFYLENWWALFILIPAVGAFSKAWSAYHDAGGRLTPQASSALFSGIIITMVAAMFLFDLSWALFGPVLLMLGGLSVLVNSRMAS